MSLLRQGVIKQPKPKLPINGLFQQIKIEVDVLFPPQVVSITQYQTVKSPETSRKCVV